MGAKVVGARRSSSAWQAEPAAPCMNSSQLSHADGHSKAQHTLACTDDNTTLAGVMIVLAPQMISPIAVASTTQVIISAEVSAGAGAPNYSLRELAGELYMYKPKSPRVLCPAQVSAS